MVGQVMLNEVYPNPIGDDTASPPQSLDEGDEWVELFNASCQDIDVGGWYVATQVLTNAGIPGGGGVIQIPAGTMIPALGTLAIGRTQLMGTVVCKIPKFVMDNEQGWVGLYNNNEEPIDAIFWSPSPGNIIGPRYSLSPCNGTGPINLPTAQIFQSMGKMKYVGADPVEATVYRRFPDGKDWQSIQGGQTPDQCNTGKCDEVPLAKIIAPKLELCSGEALELTADQPDMKWNYRWTGGTTSAGIKTDVQFTNNTKSEIIREVKLSVKSSSGFCESRDSIELTISPLKRITKIDGPTIGCAFNFSDYTVDLTDADKYIWNIEGGSVTSGQGSSDITVNWGNTTNMGRVCAEASGQCVIPTPICKSVDLLPKKNLDSIVGLQQVCANAINDYTIPSSFSAAAYAWTAINGTFIGAKNLSQAKVRWPKGGGRLCATIQSDCADPNPYCINVSTTDSILPSPIIGDSTACNNDKITLSSILSTGILKTNWSTPDSTFSFIGAKPSFDYVIKKSGEVRLQIFGQCSDTTIQKKYVRVIQKPKLNFTLDKQACVDSILTFRFTSPEDFYLSFYAIKGQIVETNSTFLKVKYFSEVDDIIKVLYGRTVGSSPCDVDTLFIPVTIKNCGVCNDTTKAKFNYSDTTFCNINQPLFPAVSTFSSLGKFTSPSLGSFLDSATGQLLLKDAPTGYHKIFNTYTSTNSLCPPIKDSVIIRNINEKLRVGFNQASCLGTTPIELSGADTFFMGAIQTIPKFILNYSKDTTIRFTGVIAKCSTSVSIDLKKDFPLQPIPDVITNLCSDPLQGASVVLLDTLLLKLKIAGSIIDLNTRLPYLKNRISSDSISGNSLKLGIVRNSGNTCPSDTVKVSFVKTDCNPCMASAKFKYDSLYCNSNSIVKPFITIGNLSGTFTSNDLANLPPDGTVDLSLLSNGTYKIFNTFSSPVLNCPKVVDSFTLNVVKFNPTVQYDSVVCKDSKVTIMLSGGDTYKISNQSINSTFQIQITKDTSLTIAINKSGCEVLKTFEIKSKNCSQDTCANQDTISELVITDFGRCVNDTVEIKARGKLKNGGLFSLLGSPSFTELNRKDTSFTFKVKDAGIYKVFYSTIDPDGNGPCLVNTDSIKLTIFQTPSKPKVIDYTVCSPTHILNKQAQQITWQSNSTGLNFTNDTLRNLTNGINSFAALVNQNGCASDTSQFIVKVNSPPNRIFAQDTLPGSRCFNTIDSLLFNFDSTLYNINFFSTVTKVSSAQYNFFNTGKLKWKLIDKSAGCERLDSVIFIQKPLNPLVLEVKNPKCSGQNDGIIILKGLVQPFDKNKLFLNGSEVSFQQSIDSLQEGKYLIKIIHPDFCDVEKIIELKNPNPLKSILQTSESGILEQGSNLVAVLQIKGGTPPYNIKWQSLNSINCDTCNQVILSIRKEELLSVTIKDSIGCDTTLSYKIEIEGNGITFPNVINANAIGDNAIFNPIKYLGEEVDLNHLSIYDRWGNTMYSSKNVPRDWPGIDFSNTKWLQGVYLFYLEINENGKADKIFGDFLLLR
jgi:hypothetical protein